MKKTNLMNLLLTVLLLTFQTAEAKYPAHWVNTLISVSGNTSMMAQQAASGNIVFGKNQSEGSVICSQQGICRLQSLADAETTPVTFQVTALPETNMYSLSMSFILDSMLAKQPDQREYFVDASSPYRIDMRLTLPRWLITALGFDSGRNRFVTIEPPFDLGVPSVPSAEGIITLTFSKPIQINP